MVFVKRQVIGGSVYYQQVKGYRRGRKVEMRAIGTFKKYSSLQNALNGAKAKAKEKKIRRSGSPEKGGRPWLLSEKE